MLLEENKRLIKLCPSTIIYDLRLNKQKTIQVFSLQAHFGRLPKKLRVIRDKFITISDFLDKPQLERSCGRETLAETPARCTNSD